MAWRTPRAVFAQVHAQGLVPLSARERLKPLADGLAVALVAALPWSTSAVAILAPLWLIVLIPTLDFTELRRTVTTAAGGLPILFWTLGVLGMLWADGSLQDRLGGLNSFHKFLAIPLLLIQFRRSERAHWALYGFLGACCLLLAVSWSLLLVAGYGWFGERAVMGIPVKDYVSQSGMFTVCICVLADVALRMWREGRRQAAAGLILLALVFLANVFFVATSRTALVVIPLLLLLFGYRSFGLKGAAGLLIVFAVAGAAAWPSSWYLRQRVVTLFEEMRAYRSGGDSPTSAGERLEFWRKSMTFVAEAPVFGHGTGSIRELFSRAAAGQAGTSGVLSANPHNQTFATAIQLGLVGAAIMLAMWLAHLWLFRAGGLAAWIGLVVVVQNVVGSLFNSHLFDFTQGWAYVLGVGVAGGVALKQVSRPAAPP